MSIKTKPFPFQIDAYRKIEQFQGRALLSLSMGLGKSLVSLLYAYNNPEKRPLLIICPASLKWNWEHECHKHFGWYSTILEGTQAPSKPKWSKPDIVIVNYDILGERSGARGKGWLEYLKNLAPQIIILDESHYIGNRQAKRTKWVRAICQDCPHVLALTGTPITTRPAQLWTTLNLINPKRWESFFPFGHRYCGAYRNFFGWCFDGASNLKELNNILNATCMIRKTTEQVMQDLPALLRSTVALDVVDYKQYQTARNNFAQWLLENAPDRLSCSLQAEALVQVGYLKRLAAELKLPATINWLDIYLESSDGKIIVFAIHKKIIAALEEKYRKHCVVLNGDTPIAKRKGIVHQFQSNPQVRMFIGNIQAAGVGLNLTAANAVAFAELDWVPANHTQAEKRANRIGSKHCLNVYYLVARNTIEVDIARLIQKRQEVFRQAIGGNSDKEDSVRIFDQLLKELHNGKQIKAEGHDQLYHIQHQT